MTGGRVQHWKHGWIPVSPEAKAWMAGGGKGPRPGGKAKGLAPNEARGIPARPMKDRSDEAKQYAAEIRDLAPELHPEAHYQFASQSMAAHYDGGVVISGADVDALIDRLAREHEGTSNRLDVAKASGSAALRHGSLPVNATKGSAEEIATRRARRLKQALGLEFKPTPHYQPAVEGSSVKGGYTGNLVLYTADAKDLIDKLNRRYTGTATREQARRAAGLRG